MGFNIKKNALVYERYSTIPLSMVKPGITFLYNEKLYMKVVGPKISPKVGRTAVVNMNSGILGEMSKEAQVTPIDFDIDINI